MGLGVGVLYLLVSVMWACADEGGVGVVQNVEKDQQDGINEETKHLEKLANKRSLLLNKVGGVISRLQGTCIHGFISERGQHEEDQGVGIIAN